AARFGGIVRWIAGRHFQSRLARWQCSNRTSSSGGAAASAAGSLQGEGRRAAKGAAVEGGVGAGGNLTLELQFQVEIGWRRRSTRRIGQGRQRIVEIAVGIETGVDRVGDAVPVHP